MADLPALERAYRQASRARDDAESAKRNERHSLIQVATARADIEMAAKHDAGIAALCSVETVALGVLSAAKLDAGTVALADFPTGIIVEYEVPLARWTSRVLGPAKPTGRRGRYEVRAANTAFPGNKSYGLPAIGDVFIRLLKKDGTPGLGYVERKSHLRGTGFGDWRPENNQAESASEPEEQDGEAA